MTASDQRTVALPEVDDLAAIVGQPGPPRLSKFPVNEPMIGLWCDAVGDENPAYQDDAWAARSRWAGITAPSTTLNMWTLPGYRRTHEVGEPLDVVRQTLDAAGFTSVAAVGNDHEYTRLLRPGDRLSQIQHLGWISPRKRTRLGEGHFFDIVSDFVTADGESVGHATMRIFKWAPGSAEPGAQDAAAEPAPAPAAEAGQPAPTRAEAFETLPAQGLAEGMQLRPWSIDLDATRIIALAAATLDYNDVHFERDAALAAGAQDIYLNILGSSGLMNRYLTDWAGPESTLRSTRVALRNQSHPGDTVTFSGTIRAVRPAEADDRALVDLDVRAVNQRGVHQVASVVLETNR